MHRLLFRVIMHRLLIIAALLLWIAAVKWLEPGAALESASDMHDTFFTGREAPAASDER